MTIEQILYCCISDNDIIKYNVDYIAIRCKNGVKDLVVSCDPNSLDEIKSILNKFDIHIEFLEASTNFKPGIDKYKLITFSNSTGSIYYKDEKYYYFIVCDHSCPSYGNIEINIERYSTPVINGNVLFKFDTSNLQDIAIIKILKSDLDFQNFNERKVFFNSKIYCQNGLSYRCRFENQANSDIIYTDVRLKYRNNNFVYSKIKGIDNKSLDVVPSCSGTNVFYINNGDFFTIGNIISTNGIITWVNDFEFLLNLLGNPDLYHFY